MRRIRNHAPTGINTAPGKSHYSRTGLVLDPETYFGSSITPDDTTWKDESGNGNDGTLTTGTGGWVQLPSGLWVYNFDGAATKMVIPSSSSLNITGDLTILTWLYLKDAYGVGSDLFTIIDRNWDEDPRTSYSLYLRGITGDLRLLRSAGGIDNSTKTSWAAGWHFIAVSSSSVSEFMFINGVTDGTGVGGSDTGFATDAYVGSTITEAHYLNGYLSALRVYNRALSSTELITIYNMERYLYGV